MKILSIDSSAKSASVAIVENDKIIGESFVNAKLTHSATLMPMVVSLLECTQEQLNDVDYFAVSAGPGSFTGLRIGVAAVKGMAMAENKPCVAISTLEAMAYNLIDSNALICAVMDARCNQFYNAIFCVKNHQLVRLCEDRALSIEELTTELKEQYADQDIILVGDGGELAYQLLTNQIEGIQLAPNHLLYQRGSGVAMAAQRKIAQGLTTTFSALVPSYLRLPQAQRELKKKNLAQSTN